MTTTESRLLGVGSCLTCRRMFVFDPGLVCSFPWPPPDGPLAPICKRCIVDKINPARKRAGHAEFPVLSGAYLEEANDA
jgi:hypothetical protein